MATRYIDPTTDFGFKRLFGQEQSKGFLEAILALPAPIADLRFIPTEQLPPGADDRIGVYDVYCTDVEGRRFIVEMQRNRQANFKERALYYLTFPIVQQVEKGSILINLLPIYSISILRFRFDDDPAHLRRVQLCDVATGSVFYDKLTLVIIELPKFTQPLSADLAPADQWIYLLQQLPMLETMPPELADEPFALAFELAAEAALSPEERRIYQANLKRVRDDASILETACRAAREEGLQEGLQEGRVEAKLDVARRMLAVGLPIATIATLTDLSEAELHCLADDQQA